MELSELFGMQQQPEPNKNVSLAALLMFLAGLINPEMKRDEEHMKDERERGSQEIPVRPRVEPLGG